MRDRNITMILATWNDVEPGDVVWDDGKLLRVTGSPWAEATSYSSHVWPVSPLGDDTFYPTEVRHNRHDQVPVVQEEYPR